jgi:hypothetical protein
LIFFALLKLKRILIVALKKAGRIYGY